MLLAGSIACIMTYLNHYSLKDMLVVLILVLVIFLIIGLIVKGIMDSIHLPGTDAVKADGEVIEKTEEEQTEAEEQKTEEGEGPDQNKQETQES